MPNYIDSDAFIENERRIYCAECNRRKGVRNGKVEVIYDIGDAPCRNCWVDDMLGDVEDFPASEVEEVKKWIPVTERLPENEEDVLAYYGFVHDGEMSEWRFFGSLAYFAFDANPHWQNESLGLTVTHWMPLPAPPKEMVTDSNQVKEE